VSPEPSAVPGDGDILDQAVIEWLLRSDEPGIRVMARRDLLDELPRDLVEVLHGPKVAALFSGQGEDGGFGVHPYQKWAGAHWRLVSLVELGIPAGEPRAVAAAGTVLDWLTGSGHRSTIVTVDGLTRRCASQEGNALAVCCRLGLGDDPRVADLAASLVSWQWPDGGWNCDVRAGGHRSSFHETLSPCWGLYEHWVATGDAASRGAAHRAAELFLEHRLFRSTRDDAVIEPTWLTIHYPPYWHYDIFQALLVLSRMGLAGDERCADAIDVLLRRRLRDGRWRPGGYWWKRPGTAGSNVEIVDWGRSAPGEMVTLNAMRVLRAAKTVD
jgi:hypothetical protein